jgi:hypothetical protein
MGEFLHTLLRRCDIPYHDNINIDKYPEQDQSLLNTIVQVKIHDNYLLPFPDDSKWDKKEKEDKLVDCRVIRYDTEQPFRAVYVSTDYKYIVTGKTSTNAFIYPVQNDNAINYSEIIGKMGYIGFASVNNYKMANWYDNIGYIVSSDTSEPDTDIIISYISEDDDRYKVLFSDEVWLELVADKRLDLSLVPSKERTAYFRKWVLEEGVSYGLNEDQDAR